LGDAFTKSSSFFILLLAPSGEICPLGGMFTLSFTPGVNTLYILLRRMERQTENLSPRYNFIPRA
jgi:hypothetical protein